MATAVDRPALSARRVVHLGLRLVLGLTLVATSVGKALDIPGFHVVLLTYNLWPEWSLWGIAAFMPVLEAFIAVSMLTGRRLRWGVLASLVLHASFATILTLELLRGVQLENCGCFGVFLARPLEWYTPLEDVVLVAITLGIALTWTGRDGRAHAKAPSRRGSHRTRPS
jgi:hypothetical protein